MKSLFVAVKLRKREYIYIINNKFFIILNVNEMSTCISNHLKLSSKFLVQIFRPLCVRLDDRNSTVYGSICSSSYIVSVVKCAF